jgi:hypothetical protein
VAVYTAMINPGTNKNINTDTSIADANTFAPVYRSSFASNHEYVLHYGKEEVTGYYFDKRTGKRTTIKDPINVPLVDGGYFDYVLSTFPLAPGFKKSLNIYNYDPANQSNVSKISIEAVDGDVYASKHFGNRDVWRVSVTVITPNGTQCKYLYYVDKDTRRIWKVSGENGGHNMLVLNNEDDYNPYHSQFDKEETLKLITAGKSVITGQAFARENDANIKGMAILNLNKKQVAKMGTDVILIPYTDFFKEWFEQNNKAGKTG